MGVPLQSCYARLGGVWHEVDILDEEDVVVVGLGAQLEGRVAGDLEVLVHGDLAASEVEAEAGVGDACGEGDKCR